MVASWQSVLVTASLFVQMASAAPHERSRRRHVAADGAIRELDPTTRQWVLVEVDGDVGRDSNEPLLAIEGRRFEYDFEAGEFLIAGQPVVVLPAVNTRDSAVQIDGDTGRTVWDAAVVLSKGFLEHQVTNGVFELHGKNVLELGAGTGLAGMAAAVLGAHVVITDLEYCLTDITRNVNATRISGPGSVAVRELDWVRPLPFFDSLDGGGVRRFDIVLAADIVWLDHLVTHLVSVLCLLLDHNPEIMFVFAHQTRSKLTDDAFFGELGKRFLISPINDLHADFSSSKVRVFKAFGRKSRE